MGLGDQVHSVYVTAADADEARRIGRALVGEGFAACVNLLWKGKVEGRVEAAFLAKTTTKWLASLRARVRALQSHASPCVVAFPVEAGEATFLDWVRGAVRTG